MITSRAISRQYWGLVNSYSFPKMANEESRRPSFVSLKSYGSTDSQSSVAFLIPKQAEKRQSSVLEVDQTDTKAKTSRKNGKTCCG